MKLALLMEMVIQTIGGLGIFLLGMKYLSDGMQAVAGQRLRRLVAAVTGHRLMAIAVGVIFTSIIQSSSITTVMVVGLVNSGVMTLIEALGVVMGANIGTTVTAWILVLKIGKFGVPIAGFSAFLYLFIKRDSVRFTAMAFLGLGLIFIGLNLMTDGFKPLRTDEDFLKWFALFNADSYLGIMKCVLMGCLITFIVQSSSATVAITMGLASNGIIGFETAAALVLGENIGTTITALLAGIGASKNARRAAVAHTLFNVLGVIWVTAIFHFYLSLVREFLGIDPGTMLAVDGAETFPYINMGIAAVHSGFNVANVVIFIPLMGFIEKILLWLIPEGGVEEEPKTFTMLNPSMLETPLIAIDNAHNEVVAMGDVALAQLDELKEAVASSFADRKKVDAIFEKEEALDGYQNEISTFLTDLLASGLQHETTLEGRLQLVMADEYESISDYIAKILKLHLRLKDAKLDLPDDEKKDIETLHDDVSAYVRLITDGCRKKNPKILVQASPQSDSITSKIRKIRSQHAERLSVSRKDPLITMIFADMLNDYRRVKDHALNIAEAVAGKK